MPTITTNMESMFAASLSWLNHVPNCISVQQKYVGNPVRGVFS